MTPEQQTAIENHCRFAFETANPMFGKVIAGEEALVGHTVDCRGTSEWATRYYAIAHKLPDFLKTLAMEEMVA